MHKSKIIVPKSVKNSLKLHVVSYLYFKLNTTELYSKNVLFEKFYTEKKINDITGIKKE